MSAPCCDPSGYRGMFSARTAERDARGYRRTGLDPMGERIVRQLAPRARDGSVLEVGGGVGAIQLELLRAGATGATNVELSGEYERAAAELAREAGLAERVDRRVGDFVVIAADIGPADTVVLHRVVCCYPYLEPLLGAAADHTRRTLAVTFPRATPLIRLGFVLVNAWMRLTRSSFRIFVHPPEAIARIAREHGFRQAFATETFVWRGLVLERA